MTICKGELDTLMIARLTRRFDDLEFGKLEPELKVKDSKTRSQS